MTDLFAETDTPTVYDRKSAVALATKLKGLHMRSLLRYTDLIVGARLVKDKQDNKLSAQQQRLSRWLRNPENKWGLLTQDEFEKILEYLRSDPKFSAETTNIYVNDVLPDAVFHSLAAWLGMSEDHYAELIKAFVGEYTAYRPSLLYPGYMFRGYLNIYHDTNTNAIATREIYIGVGKDGKEAHKSALAGSLFNRKDQYIILSRDADS